MLQPVLQKIKLLETESGARSEVGTNKSLICVSKYHSHCCVPEAEAFITSSFWFRQTQPQWSSAGVCSCLSVRPDPGARTESVSWVAAWRCGHWWGVVHVRMIREPATPQQRHPATSELFDPAFIGCTKITRHHQDLLQLLIYSRGNSGLIFRTGK